MADVKTLTVNDIKYTIKDETARTGVSQNASNISAVNTRVTTLENANFLPSAKLQFVQELPEEPEEGTYYFIPEEQ